jgi:hypothetical protein
MFEQLSELVNQIGNDAVVQNASVPNEKNEAVLNEANSTILEGLKGMVTSGNVSELVSLFQGKNSIDATNPLVQNLSKQFTSNLTQKFGLSSETSNGVASDLIPKVLGTLINNAKDPNYKGFEISDIIKTISNGSGSSGLMDAISSYGGNMDLDQNGDGKVGMDDAIAAVSKKSGGFGGMLGKLFGK